MLKILINAYACSPHTGSEPGMAWNWCISLAKHCELHIITEGEFKHNIEEALLTLPQGKNMHFYYNPVSNKVREMCWNQGDWRFYKHYEAWQYKTYEIAQDIVAKEKINILHQLNMIGFREPGYLWKIENVPLIWGPIGGLKQFPVNYLQGAGVKANLFNRLKNILNIWQLKHHKRVNAALNRASVLVSSIPDSYHAIKTYKHKESIIIPETGCFKNTETPCERFNEETMHLMWVGKFDFRKQLSLALKALTATQNKAIVLDVYGTGTEEQVQKAKQLAKDLKIEQQVVWHGNQPNTEVQKAMQISQLFFFTSVSEDTSTVVLEAISNQLPVLCFNACGFGYVINEKVGQKIALTNPEQSVQDFAKKINYLFNHRDILKEMSANCQQRQQELSWDEKVKQMVEIYQSVVED